MKNRRFLRIQTVILAVLLVPAAIPAQDQRPGAQLVSLGSDPTPGLYGLAISGDIRTPGTVYTIDATTGEATLLVASNGRASLSGLSFLGCNAYGSDLFDYPGGSVGSFDVGQIDLTSGVITFFSDQGGSVNWHGLASDEGAGLLYSIDNTTDAGVLKSLAANGTVTSIGVGTGINAVGMAFDDANGILYAIDSETSSLYTVSLIDGTATLVGPTGIGVSSLSGLAYDETKEILYLNDGISASLYTVSVIDGEATLVGANSVININGLAWVGEPCRTTESFFGLQHEAIGDALLDTNASEHLVVSNIGSSGEDGVAIALGAAEFHLIGFEPVPSAPSLPDGAFMKITANGELDGEPDQFIWSLRVEDVGDEFGLSLDSSAVEPGSVRVEALLGGEIVDSVVFQPPPEASDILVRFQPARVVGDPLWVDGDDDTLAMAIVALASPVPVTITGSESVIADSIVVASVDQAGTVGSLSSTVLQAADIPEFTIFDEALGMFELPHRTLGQASFEAEEDQLTITNIGSSGEDGVSIDIARPNSEVPSWSYETPTLDPFGHPIGAFVLNSMFGTVDGESNQLVGQSRVENLGESFLYSVDFIGSPVLDVEFFLDGTRVAEFPNYTGPGVEVFGSGDPNDKTNHIYVLLANHWYCTVSWGGKFPARVGFPHQGDLVLVDSIRMTAVDLPPVTFDGLTMVRLEASGIDELQLLDEQNALLVFGDGFESGTTSAWSSASSAGRTVRRRSSSIWRD